MRLASEEVGAVVGFKPGHWLTATRNFDFTIEGFTLPPGGFLTVTATDSAGNTLIHQEARLQLLLAGD
jgi:hypothetical protein